MRDQIAGMQVESMHRPLGLDVKKPRFGWRMASDRRGARQIAYRIRVATSPARLKEDETDVWDSGRVDSDESVNLAFAGAKLQSNRDYYWQVRVWNELGEALDSPVEHWSTGLFRFTEWKGRWIGKKIPMAVNFEQQKPAVYLRKTFSADKPIKRAYAYTTARGLYRFHVNGEEIGKDILSPEWTDYKVRVQYQAYDVTEKLTSGANALGAVLAPGWYSGYVGMYGFENYGKDASFFLQLIIEYADGTRESIVSDKSWKSSLGPITASDIQMGTAYDARLEQPGWDTAHGSEAGWGDVDIFFDFRGWLTSMPTATVQPIEERLPISVTERGEGRYIFDIGQNMVGWVKLRIEEAADAKVVVRHAEVLENGDLYTENLRDAKQTDTYVSNGKPVWYEPRFTFHGFRYVEVSGVSRPLTEADLVGVVVHTNLPLTGELTTSDAMVNQLWSNIVWTQRDNFLSVPTDCPQRSERHGWTGDAQIFCRTATYAMDVSTFFLKWLRDLRDNQQKSGAITDFAPWIEKPIHYPHVGSAGWADAIVIVPWHMYQVYGDVRVLEENFEAIEKWIRHNEDLHPEHIRDIHPQFGDWLSLHDEDTLENESKFPGKTNALSTMPLDVFATAYYAYTAALAADIAGVLGREDRARHYAELSENIKEAFRGAYVEADGTIRGHAQSCYVFALWMKLLTPEQEPLAVRHLVDKIVKNDYHMTTGFHGIKYLLPILTEYGHADIAYRLLLQTSYPSWLYSIRHGATTIWERWDGWTEHKGFQSPGMNSFNHYALGSVGEWMFRYMAGIDLTPGKIGFQRFLIRPVLTDKLEFVHASYDSKYGKIAVRWDRGGMPNEKSYDLVVTVPANTQATVRLPLFAPDSDVREGGVPIAETEGLTLAGRESDALVLEASAGTYRFTVRA
ncbi:alpha-L-rhamnosidase [Paenibacillus sp.]|uniref:alpha-L-rhamnosidase n=1 Tax=Paenibacillus sp. TaxID=58172 RepID=UPI002D5AF07F|nr:family 78 glycoside hydrolase catalytic domain [Paenibacillus sp.]HZG58822.1 family 78 glycoside hydrolase catalytic domain [Paenibacillus sp.]